MNFKSYSKPKLSKEYTFPLNSQILNNIFSEIDSQDEVEAFFKSDIDRSIALFAPYSFGSLTYLKNETRDVLNFKRLASANYSLKDNSWIISIYPCLKIDGEKVKLFLNNIGLEVLKNWIAKDKNETWYIGQRFIQLGLNEDSSKFCILETQNEYVISKEIKNVVL